MPIIEPIGWPQITAIMHYPNDHAKREQFVVDVQDPLLHCGKPHMRGSLAGSVLYIIYRAAKHHPEHKVSFEKAAFVLRYLVERGSEGSGLKTFTGKRVWASEEHIRKWAWRPYRTVAHLWAAYRLLLDFRGRTYGVSSAILELVWQDMETAYRHLLSIAEQLRAFGEGYWPSPRYPLLPHEAMWRVREDVRLPRVKLDKLALPLPEDVLAVLRGYRIKKRCT